MSDKRRMPRTRKRLSCSLTINEQRYSGIVLDVSATGLFIQTSATPKPGSNVGLEVQIAPGESLPLQATVARRRNVPNHLKSIATGGVGLCLEGAPEEYFALIKELQAPREATTPEDDAARPKKLPHSDLARRALLARLEKLRTGTD
jgi:hypothetical protein